MTKYIDWWTKDFIDRQYKVWGDQWGERDFNGLPINRSLRFLLTNQIEREQKYGQERERIFNAGYELGKEEKQ